MASDPMAQVVAGFVNEAKELCQRATLELLNLERLEPGSAEMVRSYKELARALHTLKGSAATLGLDALAKLAHGMEERIAPSKKEAVRLPAEAGDELLAGLDRFLEDLQTQVDGKGGEAQGDELPIRTHDEAPSEVAMVPDDRAQWRVEAGQVVALIREVERLRELHLRLDERKREADRALAMLSGLGMFRETAEVRALLMGQSRALASDGEATSDLLRSLEDGVKAISSMPVRSLLDPLHRAVRDLCRSTGKEARLSAVGAEISLDRRVLEALRGPLVHLLRNAVDHGVEVPARRIERGKHPEGALTIRVEQQGNMLFLEVADDGNGIDVERVKQVALERGLQSREDLDEMTAAQVAQLIFRSGFSTRTEVSSISGRGVGLDAVKAEVRALHGNVEVQSVPGQGTRFVLTVPVELGSSPMLLVRAGEQEFALPMLSVQSTLRASRASIRASRSEMRLEHSGELLPLVDLGALLKLREPEMPQEGQPILIVQAQGQRAAVLVDRMSGDRELVVRPLPAEVRSVEAYQGACTLARGELVAILRPDWLVSPERKGERQLRSTRRALVVDDSLTARALHRAMLESGGFTVHAVGGGRQALEQLRHTSYDVMVSDIGMEEMDGYALTATVRSHPELGRMPIILVSGRDSDEDRAQGRNAGADGFLSKRDCAAGRLLAEVAQAIAQRRGGEA